jgi:hypothetical protein
LEEIDTATEACEWISTGAVKAVSTYEEVIVSCSGHDVSIKRAGAAASKRTGWDP